MSDDNSQSRRSLLMTIGAAGSSAVGLAGVASADQSTGVSGPSGRRDRQKVAAASREAGRIVQREAGDVLRDLHELDVIERPAVDVFDFETEFENRTQLDAETELDGYAVTAFAKEGDSEATTLVMVSKTTDTHGLTLYVQPEADKSYAIVQELSGSERFLVHSETEEIKIERNSTESSEIGTLSGHCDYSFTNCEGTCRCSGGGRYAYIYEVTYECYDIGSKCKCDATGSDCEGCYCSSQKPNCC